MKKMMKYASFWLTLSGQGCPAVTNDVGEAIRRTVHRTSFIRYGKQGKF